MEMEPTIGIPFPNHITIGITSPDPFGDVIKAIIDGEKIWPASSGNDLTELEDERKRLAHEIFVGAERLDLVGHSTPIKCYLKIGDWVLDPAGAERLASYLPRSVKIVRLIGCNTASTEEGRAAIVAFTRSSLVAYGTLNKVYSTHFDKDGVKKVPGAPSMRGFFPAERDPEPLPTSSDMPERSPSRGLLVWLRRGTWRAFSGLYWVFIRLLPKQWALRSRIWGFLHSEGESMPGLLTEPLLTFKIASRSGIWMLEILFDFEYARFYPSEGSAENRDRVYGIHGFERAAKTPLEAYLERGRHGVTLIDRHEEAGERCAGALPKKGGKGDAGQKPGRPFRLISLVVATGVALAVLLALFALSTFTAGGGGTRLQIPSDAPADGGGTPSQSPSDASAGDGDTPKPIPSDAPAGDGGTPKPKPPDAPAGNGGTPKPKPPDAPAGNGGTPKPKPPAFTGHWNYSWGDTKYSFTNIGTSTNRTCFMSGLAGNLIPAGATGQTGAGVRINANGDYEIYVDSDGGELGTFARCVNTSAGRTAEVTWRTGDAAKHLGVVMPSRRCFLTNVITSNAYPSEGGRGFRSNSDYVRIWQDGVNWWVGGVQSGVVWAKARCIDVNADDGSWEWIAGDSGMRKDPLSGNPGGVTCLLTGVGGHFDHNDWVDGAYVSYDAGANRFYMNTKNGHTGWVNCVH